MLFSEFNAVFGKLSLVFYIPRYGMVGVVFLGFWFMRYGMIAIILFGFWDQWYRIVVLGSELIMRFYMLNGRAPFLF